MPFGRSRLEIFKRTRTFMFLFFFSRRTRHLPFPSPLNLPLGCKKVEDSSRASKIEFISGEVKWKRNRVRLINLILSLTGSELAVEALTEMASPLRKELPSSVRGYVITWQPSKGGKVSSSCEDELALSCFACYYMVLLRFTTFDRSPEGVITQSFSTPFAMCGRRSLSSPPRSSSSVLTRFDGQTNSFANFDAC